MNHPAPVSPARRWALARRLALMGVAAAVVAAPAVASAATPANLLLDSASPEYNLITVKRADGGAVTTRPSLFNQNITPAGQALYSPAAAFCIDLDHPIDEGINYSVLLSDATDDPALAGPAYRQVTWLVDNAPQLIANSVNKPLEAGAIQVAIWQLVAGASQASDVTNDTQLNSRVAALRTLAAAGRVAGPITITSSVATACSTATVPLALTGTPGTTATVAVSAGTAQLSAPSVTFDANGAASVSLSGAAPGTVSVTATAAGTRLVRAGRTSPTAALPQDTVHVRPITYTSTASVAITNCAAPAPGTPGAPTTPVVNPTVNPPVTIDACIKTKLGVDVKAPKSVLAGSKITVELTARNSGTVTADNSVLRFRIPAGFSLVMRPSKAAVSGGVVSIRVGDMAPGSVRRASIMLRADRNISGGRRHSATITAECGANRTGAAVTQVRVLPGPRQPAVTG